MIYSRYADDITLSWKHYATKEILTEKFDAYEEILNKKNKKEEFQKLMDNFPQEVFNATDNFERKYINERINKIKKLINKSSFLTEDEKCQYIGIINTYKKRIQATNRRIDNIQDEIIKIIGKEGRTLNPKKIKARTPQSNTEREINGICFDENGKRSLNREKQGAYRRLFRELFEKSVYELSENSYYARKFKLKDNYEKSYKIILSTLRGVYNRIKNVYGKEEVPKKFSEMYEQNVQKRTDYSAREANPQK